MSIKNLTKWFAFVLMAAGSSVQAIQLTVSVPPLAGLLKPLLDDSDQLVVLLKPGVSPHGFQLKPSHLKAIQTSDAVFSIGTPVDSWLEKTLNRVEQPTLKMSELHGLHIRPIRNGGLWLKASETQVDSGHNHTISLAEEHHGHHHQSENWPYDGHIWLSIENARLFVAAAAELIKQLKPQQVAAVEQKKQAWLAQLEQLDQRLTTKLAVVKDRPFVVLHDAYQYFEHHYRLNGVGSVRLNPEVSPSLKRIQQLRNSIRKNNVACVFKEPQFPEKRVLAVVRGLDVKIGSLDPMGSFVPGSNAKVITDGFLGYDALLDGLASSMVNCLTVNDGN